MKNYSDIATRYMKENKKRTSLTILGIVLATVLIFAIGTFLLSFRNSLIKDCRSERDSEFTIHCKTSEELDKLINNVEIKNYSLGQSNNEVSYQVKNSDLMATLELGDSNYYKKIVHDKLVDGHYPKKDNEVIINSIAKKKLNCEIGDNIVLINNEGIEEEYVISGISKVNGYYSSNDIVVNGFLSEEDLSEDTKAGFDAYVNLKSDSDKQEIINKVIKDAGITVEEGTKTDNSRLLYLTGNGGNEDTNNGIRNIAIFVIAIVIICTITVIYNSFNISVIERIKYFGILKSIGATNKQIKRIIYKEGLLMALIALPIGCLIGFFALKFGVQIFLGNKVLLMDLDINFYPIIILITLIVVGLTTFISIMGPARKVKKITAVEAMRNKNEIKLGKIKKRKNRIIGKIFGIEGSIAYKNIRRTPMRFIITVVALTISIVLFNVFYSFIDYAKQFTQQQFMDIPFESQLISSEHERSFSDEELQKIQSLEYFRDMYKYIVKQNGSAYIEKNRTTKYAQGSNHQEKGYVEIRSDLYGVSSNKELDLIKDQIIEGSLDYDKLKDNGVVLVDGFKVVDTDGNKKIGRLTDYKVGDKIRIPINIQGELTDENINNNTIEVTVVAISNKSLLGGSYNANKIELIFLKDVYNNLIENKNYNLLTFNSKNDEAKEDAISYFDKVSEELGYSYVDLGDYSKKMTDLYNQVEFFVYCFVIAITIISVVNIFNTISTNLLLRKKEFATLKAIGMTEGQLSKSIILEGTLYGIMSSIVGGILSVILSKLLINAGGGVADFSYEFPIVAFSLSILVAISITYISTLVPLRKLKKQTIVEGISDDE